MALDLYSDVILTRDVGEHGLRAGEVGTVVERHVVPGVAEEGYSVEFFNMTGNTVTERAQTSSASSRSTPERQARLSGPHDRRSSETSAGE